MPVPVGCKQVRLFHSPSFESKLTVAASVRLISDFMLTSRLKPMPNIPLDMVIAWGCLFIFNIVIFILTAYKSYKLRGAYSKELIVIMSRDGENADYLTLLRNTNLTNRNSLFLVRRIARTSTTPLKTPLSDRVFAAICSFNIAACFVRQTRRCLYFIGNSCRLGC